MEIKTIADRIYEEIKVKGKVKASEIVRRYKISYLVLEDWMKELEKAGLVKIVYPTNPFGDVIIYDREVWENECARGKKSGR